MWLSQAPREEERIMEVKDEAVVYRDVDADIRSQTLKWLAEHLRLNNNYPKNL